MATFGKTDTGSHGHEAYSDQKIVSKFTLTENGSVTKLTAYLAGGGASGSQVHKGIIYSDNSGSPDALQGTTSEITVAHNDAAAWVDLAFSSPLDLTAGDYWLGLISGADIPQTTTFYADSTGGSHAIANDTYVGGAASTFGTPIEDGNHKFAIYATYTEPTTGSGALHTASVAISGAGKVTITGSGALTVGGVQISGAGTRVNPVGFLSWPFRWLGGKGDRSASGAVQVGAVQVSGAGKVIITGSGSLTVGGVQIQGAGSTGITTGSGAISIGAVQIAGAGTVKIIGSGALQIGAISILGAGVWGPGCPGPIGDAGTCRLQPFTDGTATIQPIIGGEARIHES